MFEVALWEYAITMNAEALTKRLELPFRALNCVRITIQYYSHAAQVLPFHRKHLRA